MASGHSIRIRGIFGDVFMSPYNERRRLVSVRIYFTFYWVEALHAHLNPSRAIVASFLNGRLDIVPQRISEEGDPGPARPWSCWASTFDTARY